MSAKGKYNNHLLIMLFVRSELLILSKLVMFFSTVGYDANKCCKVEKYITCQFHIYVAITFDKASLNFHTLESLRISYKDANNLNFFQNVTICMTTNYDIFFFILEWWWVYCYEFCYLMSFLFHSQASLLPSNILHSPPKVKKQKRHKVNGYPENVYKIEKEK